MSEKRQKKRSKNPASKANVESEALEVAVRGLEAQMAVSGKDNESLAVTEQQLIEEKPQRKKF